MSTRGGEGPWSWKPPTANLDTRRCTYVYDRGFNIGRVCGAPTDVRYGPFCTVHGKIMEYRQHFDLDPTKR